MKTGTRIETGINIVLSDLGRVINNSNNSYDVKLVDPENRVIYQFYLSSMSTHRFNTSNYILSYMKIRKLV